jgi:hypothetical protein
MHCAESTHQRTGGILGRRIFPALRLRVAIAGTDAGATEVVAETAETASTITARALGGIEL